MQYIYFTPALLKNCTTHNTTQELYNRLMQFYRNKTSVAYSFQKYCKSFFVDFKRHHLIHELLQQNVLFVIVAFDRKLHTYTTQ